MAKDTPPVTAAVRMLREHGVAFTHHFYTYEERGGTAVSARELGLPEHAIVKTLVMEDDAKHPLVVLMHGDREVSTKALARALGVKSVGICAPQVADRHSGYQVGGTSPFGTRRTMPIYVERSDRRPALSVRQRRPARLPRRHGARRADPGVETDPRRRRRSSGTIDAGRVLLAGSGDFAYVPA